MSISNHFRSEPHVILLTPLRCGWGDSAARRIASTLKYESYRGACILVKWLIFMGQVTHFWGIWQKKEPRPLLGPRPRPQSAPGGVECS